MKKKEMVKAIKELPGVRLDHANVYGRRFDDEVYLGEVKTRSWCSVLEVYPSKRSLRSITRVINDPQGYLRDIPALISHRSSLIPEYISCHIDGSISFNFEIGSNIISLEYDRDGHFHEAFVR